MMSMSTASAGDYVEDGAGRLEIPHNFTMGKTSMDAQNTVRTKLSRTIQSTAEDRSANALRHGLAGSKCLPPALRPGRVDELFNRLKQEVKPRSFLDELALREIARHAAILDIIEQGEPAVLRRAALDMAELVALDSNANDDVAMAMAVTAEPLERVSRYRRAHEKALHAALDRMVAPRQPADVMTPPISTAPKESRFTTSAECESFLRGRFVSANWSCPGCGGRTGTYRKRLKAWACSSCDRSVGLRQGTIFERSGVALPIWFVAIDVVAKDLHIEARDLAERVEIKRVATARKMLHKIRGALTSSVMAQPGMTPIDTVVNVVHPNAFLRNENSASPTSGRCANQSLVHS
jgi:transposase-like protein